jgi:hypothetical protein
MPTHWTYAAFDRADDLYQGDLLIRTPALDAVLTEVHAYFRDPKFVAFVIITQTCDLVQRGRDCKAEHINIAVVRELEPILPDIVGKIAGTGVPGLYRRSARLFAIELLNRIINQNELARGIFYLHPDGDVGIATPSVAMLRISIALRREHYPVLRDARRGRLEAEFRNKLGWLCGNLFSRIATPDWNEASRIPDASRRQAESLLASIDGGDREFWIPETWVDSAKKAGVSFEGKTKNELVRLLRQHAPPEPLEAAFARGRTVALRIIAAEQANAMKDALGDDAAFRSAIVEHLFGLVEELGDIDPAGVGENIRGTEPITGSASQAAFPVIRFFLETQSDRPLSELAASLRTVGIQRPTVRALESVIKTLVAKSADGVEVRLDRLIGCDLFSNVAVDIIVEHVRSLAQTTASAAVEKLVSRLRNDQQFSKLLQASPPLSLPDTD